MEYQKESKHQTHRFFFSCLTFVGPVKRGKGRTSQQVTLWHHFIREQPLTPSEHHVVQPPGKIPEGSQEKEKKQAEMLM